MLKCIVKMFLFSAMVLWGVTAFALTCPQQWNQGAATPGWTGVVMNGPAPSSMAFKLNGMHYNKPAPGVYCTYASVGGVFYAQLNPTSNVTPDLTMVSNGWMDGRGTGNNPCAETSEQCNCNPFQSLCPVKVK